MKIQLRGYIQPQSTLAEVKMLGQCDCDCACTISGTKQHFISPVPTSYFLEITPVCPNQCSGCGNVFIDRSQENNPTAPPLGLKQWMAILEKISSTASIIRVTGGEPASYPAFFEIIQELENAKIPFNVLTTGIWAEPDRLIAQMRKLAYFRGFLISLHGADAATHRAFSGTPFSFQRSLDAMQRAGEAGLPLSANTVITQQNYTQFRQIVALALERGAHQVIFSRYIGKSIPGISPAEGEMRQAIQSIMELQQTNYPVRFGNCIPQCFEPTTSRGCTAGETYCTIDPWGNVRPCNHAPLITGNLFTGSIEEIWHSQPFQDWREEIGTSCTGCAVYESCRGGCKAMRLQFGEDPLVCKPIREKDTRPAENQIILYAGSTVKKNYRTIEQGEGVLITHEGRNTFLSHEQAALLTRIDESSTLAFIQENFGERGLNFIGELYAHGFIEVV